MPESSAISKLEEQKQLSHEESKANPVDIPITDKTNVPKKKTKTLIVKPLTNKADK